MSEARTDDDLNFDDLEALAESGDLDARLASLGEDQAGEEATDEAAEAAAKAEAEEGASTDGDETDEGKAAAEKDQADKEAADQAAAEKAKAGEGEPKPVIKTRDGKHEMPYSVLESERRQKAELKAQLDAAQSQLEALKAGKPQEDVTDTTDTGKDIDLDKFAEEYGEEMAAPLRKMQADLDATRREAAETARWRAEQQKGEETKAAVSTEEAIDLVFADATKPGEASILRQWQQAGGEEWDEAVAIDNALMSLPKWADKPQVERFEEVVRRMNRAPEPPKTTEKPNPKDSKQRPASKPADPDEQVPLSQSDLPGGEAPDQSHMETAERITPKEMENKMLDMTPDQIEDYLSRL